jgi:hypothetical protein
MAEKDPFKLDPGQFKFRPEPQLKERLERCAAKSGFPTPQQFVIAALDSYAELLANLLRERRGQDELLLKRQKEQVLSKGGQGQDSGRRK